MIKFLSMICLALFLLAATEASAVDGHIEGNMCYSNAGPGEIQGANGSASCGNGASCNYVSGSCTIGLAGPNSTVLQGGAVKAERSVGTKDLKLQSK